MTHKAEAAIIEILKRDGHTQAIAGISTTDLVAMVHKENPGLFGTPPAQGSAASTMTTVYRDNESIHRVKLNNAYHYFFDDELQLEKVIERSNRMPATKKILVSRNKSLIKEKKPVTMTPSRRIETVEADKPDEYQIVRTLDGKPAGVVFAGILFTTLEQFVQTLNGKLRGS